MSYEVVCLGDHPELIEQCANLLNSQWPKSLSSRLRSLKQTRNEECPFPTSLLLIQKTNGDISVIGHSKILPVPHSTDACFVESVVIESKLRNKGLGRIIMEGTENFVKRKGVKAVHLTTHDQEGFYRKLGYELSEPIVVYGGISSNLQKFIETHENYHQPIKIACPEQKYQNNNNCQTTSPSLPPPPPPPPPVLPVDNNNVLAEKKVYMVKYLIET